MGKVNSYIPKHGKRKKKLNRKNALILFIFLVCLCLFAFSGIKILLWFYNNQNIKKIVKETEIKTKVEEVVDSKQTVTVPAAKNDKEELYQKYIKMNLINVDFKDLKEMNSDFKGWIKVAGSDVNYPFVPTTNNDYYLTHALDKTYNTAGWVFLDYRNNIENLDKNTIIYAHGRRNNTMFGSLRNITNNGWLDNSNNFVIKLSTETENTLWRVFSVYVIPTTNDYLYNNFSNDQNFMEFVDKLIKRSSYDFQTSVSKEDYLLTLSTCFNDSEKTVIHAKLIKKETR